MIKIAFKYGLMGSAVLLIIFFIYYFTGSNPLIEMDFLDVFVLPVFLFFGVKEYRDVVNNKVLAFWQGMSVGFIIYGTIAILVPLITWVVLALDSSIAADYIADLLQSLAENKETLIEKLGQEKYEKTVSDAGSTTNYYLVLDILLKKLATGFLLTSVISVVMKRKEKP